MNQSPVNEIKLNNSAARISAPAWRRVSAVAAIFLLQVNLALASGQAAQQAPPQADSTQAPAPQNAT
ncbi:MAG: hypothetical protein WBE76_17370, partial [Terracidiphilus sp.]